MSDHYDLVVIGAGPAGEKGAAQAAFFGKRVCIVERAPKPGGVAVNAGAVPSKALRETAMYFSGLRRHGLYGVEYHVRPDLTVPDFMFREREAVEAEWERIGENLRRHRIDTVQGTARFVNARMIEVSRFDSEPQRISADAFLIATGAVAHRPPEIPFDDERVVDWEALIRLEAIPPRLVIVGSGPIECEYACIFGALGSRVTLVSDADRMLPGFDSDVVDALRRQMTERFGIAVQLGVAVSGVRRDGDVVDVHLADGTTRTADVVLVGTAPHGNVAELRLDVAGVRVDIRGFVHVDEHFRSSVPYIYAAGDVIGGRVDAALAIEQARVAICHAFELRYKQRVSPVPPIALFTIPEIATVGETEDAARARGVAPEIGVAHFRANPRGQLTGESEGFLKLVFRPEDQRLLGVSIVGPGAAEIIHIGMTALMYEATLDCFIQSVYAYPTLADAYKYAAYDGLQRLARRVAKRMSLRATPPRPLTPPIAPA